MAEEILMEKPRIGQCLTLWEEFRSKANDWCSKFHIIGGHVEKVIDRRFRRNYHPAWAVAFILDPLYLIRDTSGKYLPPFKFLTPEQEKDVDKLITRLESRDKAHIALMELMKWRTEGLDPASAQAVQLKQRDPNTGKMRIAIPQSSRLVWETHLTEFQSLGKVAVKIDFPSCNFMWIQMQLVFTEIRECVAHPELSGSQFPNFELLNDSPKLNNDAPMEQHKTMLDSDFLTKIKLIAHHYRYTYRFNPSSWNWNKFGSESRNLGDEA
ncbi:hypothetical protein F511_01103 [Olea europaea subsp. europaea]|uniref:Uncharacterized protein n=1 Tax=Olea europaea subsp. europaea TaxID=158383 RepID=A0A8S0RJI1_OLEEU|nr:hypothetical protein F511_01103 [Olea europaea subsp. europaea]